MNRRAYMAALHDALDRLLKGRTSIEFHQLQSELEATLEATPPSPLVLAEALTGRGWIKRPDTAPTVYDFAPGVAG